MKEIQLDKGMVARVDDEDFEFLSRYEWIARPFGNNRPIYYAVCNSFNGPNNRVLMHRVLMPNPPDGCNTDHIDRDGLNNQKNNLRYANRYQQRWNQAKREGSQTQYIGVRLQKDRQDKLARPWQARVRSDGKTISLGYYATQEEAALARDSYVAVHRAGYAVLNFPPSD